MRAVRRRPDFNIAEKIAELNSLHLNRLCEANYYGMVGKREIQAAIYAAKQMPFGEIEVHSLGYGTGAAVFQILPWLKCDKEGVFSFSDWRDGSVETCCPIFSIQRTKALP